MEGNCVRVWGVIWQETDVVAARGCECAVSLSIHFHVVDFMYMSFTAIGKKKNKWKKEEKERQIEKKPVLETKRGKSEKKKVGIKLKIREKDTLVKD